MFSMVAFLQRNQLNFQIRNFIPQLRAHVVEAHVPIAQLCFVIEFYAVLPFISAERVLVCFGADAE